MAKPGLVARAGGWQESLTRLATLIGDSRPVTGPFPGLPHGGRRGRHPWGAEVVWLRDPDGNLLSIVSYAGSYRERCQ